MLDNDMREDETHHVKFFVIHDHHLAVIADQVARSARHGNAAREESRLQVSQRFFPTAIGECDQRLHENAAFRGIHKRSLHFCNVEAEDQNLDALLRFLNALEQRIDSRTGLDEQSHVSSIRKTAALHMMQKTK